MDGKIYQLVVIDDKMCLKENGEIVDMPVDLSEDLGARVAALWRKYDESGQPFMLYGPEWEC